MSGQPYFFLSYASNTDIEVKGFFADLSVEVATQAGLTATAKVGFFDQDIALDAANTGAWNEAIADALGAAQVLVPLYSPHYFNKSWTMREQESFRQRLRDVKDPSLHIVPILWTPFPSWQINDEISLAMRFGQDIPQYLDDGVRALRMLDNTESYREVLQRLAARIVDCAQHHALVPSEAPDVSDAPNAAPRDAQFIVAVIAPAGENVPAQRNPGLYGDLSRMWRPFADRQVQPIAEYAAGTAEQLGATTIFDGFAEVRKYLSLRPAVVLVDPWILRTPGGEQSLQDAVAGLHVWAPPLLVIDDEDRSNAEESVQLARQVASLMTDAGVPSVMQVSQLHELANILPRLISYARNQFLKHGRPPGAASSAAKDYTLRQPDMSSPTNGKVDQ